MNIREAYAFLRYLLNLTEGKIVFVAAFTLFMGLTESISLILLIPIAAAASPGNAEQLNQIPVIGDWLARTSPSLIVLLVIFVVLVTVQSALTRAKNIYSTKIMQKASDKMSISIFETIGMAHWRSISSRRGSDINHVLESDTDRIMAAASSVLSLFQAVVMLVFYIALAALVSWQMALFASIIGSILFGILYPIRRRAAKHGKHLTELYQEKNYTVLEFISGIRLAKLFTAESHYAQIYSNQLISFRKSVLDFVALSSLGTLIFQIGAVIIASTFVWIAITIYTLDIARIGVLLLIFARLAPRFNMIQNATQQFLTNAPAYSNFQETSDYFLSNRESDSLSSEKAPSLKSSIQFSDVTVKFANAAKPSLDNINCNFRGERITAVIGPSGSGKSTLADLIMGLIRADDGRIMVDGIEITEENLRAWRSSVACVPQDAFLFNDTIAANLRLARYDASDEDLWDCLDQANIGDFIRELPDGLETVAGDRGLRFSGGEKQRIALARALLRKPQLLVLDEATSALDWENQRKISAAIETLRGQLTIVTIAHRASLITFADDVIALQGGNITEHGTFEALKANPNSDLSMMLKGENV